MRIMYIIVLSKLEEDDLTTDLSIATNNLSELKSLLNELFLDIFEKYGLNDELLDLTNLNNIDFNYEDLYVYKNSESFTIEYSDADGYHKIIGDIKPILVNNTHND